MHELNEMQIVPTSEQVAQVAYWYWRLRMNTGLPGDADGDWYWALNELRVRLSFWSNY
jgi:hypothetical protein